MTQFSAIRDKDVERPTAGSSTRRADNQWPIELSAVLLEFLPPDPLKPDAEEGSTDLSALSVEEACDKVSQCLDRFIQWEREFDLWLSAALNSVTSTTKGLRPPWTAAKENCLALQKSVEEVRALRRRGFNFLPLPVRRLGTAISGTNPSQFAAVGDPSSGIGITTEPGGSHFANCFELKAAVGDVIKALRTICKTAQGTESSRLSAKERVAFCLPLADFSSLMGTQSVLWDRFRTLDDFGEIKWRAALEWQRKLDKSIDTIIASTAQLDRASLPSVSILGR